MTFRASARTAAAALLVGGLLIGDRDVYPWSVNPPTVPQETERSDAELFYRRLEAYTAVLNLVETGYAEPIDVNRAIARSIQRMLSRLDPHSSFYNPKTFRELRAYQGGNYSGIGARVAPVDGQLMVLSTTPGSPAWESGIRPGDVILSVDGVSNRDRPGAEVVRLLRGARGTLVEVWIERMGVNQPLRLKIRREEIPEPSLPVCFAIPARGRLPATGGLHGHHRR